MRRRLPMVVAALAVAVTMKGGAQSNENPTIALGNDNVGTIESVRIDKEGKGSRIDIHITAKFPMFPTSLDDILKSKGNIGGCQQRFFWRGDTKLNGGGAELSLTSRIGYEAWTCPQPIKLPFGKKISLPRVRVIGDARNVQWTMFIKVGFLDEIYLGAHVNNIVGWPNWIEKLFGARITKHIPIVLPKACGSCSCKDLMSKTRPRLNITQFTVGEDGELQVMAVLSVNDDVLHWVLSCQMPG